MDIKIKKLREGAILPKKETVGSAAYDVYVPERVQVKLHRSIVPLGWSISMPASLGLDNRTRAGYASKGIVVVDDNNNEYRIDADVILGLIDSDYRGEMGAIIKVFSLTEDADGKPLPNVPLYYKMDKPLSQLKFCVVPDTTLVEVDELDETDRGSKGFGGANGE